ncbi:MAG: carbon-nitrogen hydrolase family protein [Campylobacterota bacterium]|nr:carbon-nitrogen hydrolase family protein [Campylobacterota bacterium]
MSTLKAAVLQLPSIGMSSTRLYRYVRQAHKEGVKLLVLGEYLLNPFFHELRRLSIAMIKEQSDHQMKLLRELSSTHEMTIVAAIIIVKKKQPFKMIVKVSPHSVSYYKQQILLAYKHWDEERFFANETEALIAPPVFKIDGVRCAIMSGFELHFDAFFSILEDKNIDVIIVPSVSTFESHQRWQELIKMRSFTHNCYILRANRIGEYQDGEYEWKFYGDSLLSSPDGIIETSLGNTEELMIVEIDHKRVLESRKSWGFKDAMKVRAIEH